MKNINKILIFIFFFMVIWALFLKEIQHATLFLCLIILIKQK